MILSTKVITGQLRQFDGSGVESFAIDAQINFSNITFCWELEPGRMRVKFVSGDFVDVEEASFLAALAKAREGKQCF